MKKNNFFDRKKRNKQLTENNVETTEKKENVDEVSENDFDDFSLLDSDIYSDDLYDEKVDDDSTMFAQDVEKKENIEIDEQNDSAGQLIKSDNQVEVVADSVPAQQIDENKPIKVKEIAIQSDATRVNKVDLFFLRVWAGIIAMITYIADALNYFINLIFKKKLPTRYVKAFVSVVLVVLLLLCIILPFTANAQKAPSEFEIFNCDMVPVKIISSYDNDGYPIYKWGYLDKKNASDGIAKESLAIPAIYEEALPFCKYKVAWVRVKNNNGHYWELINTKGKRVGKKIYYVNNSVPITERPFGEFTDSKMCWVNEGGKYGYIDTKGNIKIRSSYDVAGDFIDGVARVGRGNKEWFITTKEKKIGRDDGYEQVLDFSCGLGAVKNEKWGFVNKKGDEVIAPQYDAVSQFVDGYAMVKMGDTFGIIDTKGKSIVGTLEYYDINLNHPIFVEFLKENRK